MKLAVVGNTRSVYATSAPASGIIRTRRPYVRATGMSSSAPPRKPSIAPPGPPRPSQSSMTTSQPAPTILPKPNVKYSSAPRLWRRLVVRDSKLVLECREQSRGEELRGCLCDGGGRGVDYGVQRLRNWGERGPRGNGSACGNTERDCDVRSAAQHVESRGEKRRTPHQ